MPSLPFLLASSRGIRLIIVTVGSLLPQRTLLVRYTFLLYRWLVNLRVSFTLKPRGVRPFLRGWVISWVV